MTWTSSTRCSASSRATAPDELFDAELAAIQRDLFSIGGHLATPDPEQVAKALAKAALSSERVADFERMIDQADQRAAAAPRLRAPGGKPQGRGLPCGPHRLPPGRAERGDARPRGRVPELFLAYLNRLSDLLFTLARLANHREGVEDVTW